MSYDNPFLLNPAYTGLKSNNINLYGQKQWIDIKKSPGLYSFNADGRIGTFNFYDPSMMLNKTKFKSKGRTGLGLNIFSEKQGAYNIFGSNLTYGYHISGENKMFSFGLLLNYTSISLNTNDMNPSSDDDPLLQQSKIKDNYFNSGIGIAFSTNKYNVGLSSLHFLKNYLNDNRGMDFYYQEDNSINFNFEYNKRMNNYKISPKFLIIYNYESIRYTIGFEMHYNRNIGFAFNYQSFSALGISLNYEFTRFYMNYQVNIPVWNNRINTLGTYGITIGRNLAFSE